MHKKCSRDLHTHTKKNPKCFFFFFFFLRPNSNKIAATGPYLKCIPKNWRTGWSNQGSSARESRRYGHSSYNKIAQHHAWSFNKTHSKTITGLNTMADCIWKEMLRWQTVTNEPVTVSRRSCISVCQFISLGNTSWNPFSNDTIFLSSLS